MREAVSVKVYHGYGHTQNLVVFGHVFKGRAKINQRFSNNLLINACNLVKLFMVKPFAFTNIKLHFFGKTFLNKTEADGFFKFEWQANEKVAAGWHEVKIDALNEAGDVMAEGFGKIYVPHITQYAFISDIDDTVVNSYSATLWRRLKVLLTKNPRTRTVFSSTANYYQQLAVSHTTLNQPNPFFYVSSSEWNLYDYLTEAFKFNQLPDGIFLLNTIKRLKDFFKTGKTGHQGKLLRVMRVLDTFPEQKFVFFGDNSQQDPQIYETIVQRYPKNIMAVYIRNVRLSKAESTLELLDKIETLGISTCLFTKSEEAMAHSKKIGLIAGEDFA
ncbi:phosphatidate phosphatase APP1 [Pedobacter sp. UYP30]|uniref:App1 family protein n=1 Tax=Pedobacter sp. UYP30 TaxID=1756400 RepID=UPI0033942045